MKLLKLLVAAIAFSTLNGFAQTDFEPYTQNIEGTDVSFKMVPIKGTTLITIKNDLSANIQVINGTNVINNTSARTPEKTQRSYTF